MKKRNIVVNVAISLISISLLSCNGSKKVSENVEKDNSSTKNNQTETTETVSENKPEEVFEPKPEEKNSNQADIKPLSYNPKLMPDMLGAHYDIEKAELSGNQLYITVSYSGGCKKHEFGLYHNKMLSKSMPPVLTIYLTHENNEDECEQYITKKIIFDVSALEKDFPELKEIKLQISNFDNTLMYNK